MHSLIAVAPLLGIMAMAMSLSHLLPIAISIGLNDGEAGQFALSMGANFAIGFATWMLTRSRQRELKIREGILLVVLVWTGGGLFASLPLLLAIPGLSFTDAYFEAISGLTATGATVLVGLDALPASLNVWRAELQWIGGMGVIVLAVAILPMTGLGGRQIFKSETPGPMKEDALTPRLTETAKWLWLVYAGLTLACGIAYRLAGMGWIDALVHSFTTMALGGFSSHDASFGYFDSPLIESVAIVFMLIAGLNFTTHFVALRGRSILPYLRDPEAGMFLAVAGASVVLVSLFLWQAGHYHGYLEALRFAAFNVVSVGTTTGYATADYDLWPVFAPLWVLFLGTFMSCSRSTGGGIKLIRAIMLFRQLGRELRRLAHPNAIAFVKVAGAPVANQVIFAVLAFWFAWIALLVTCTLLMAISGADAMTAFSASVASLANIGPGLHQVGPSTTFGILTPFQKWVCSAAMLLGRLELFTLLVILTPAFWRK